MSTTVRYGVARCLVVGIAVTLALGLAGCGLRFGSDSHGSITGSGAPVEEERPVSGVEAVEVTNEGDLTVETGDVQRLVVQAQEQLLPYIETDMRGGTLVIGTKEGYDLDASEPIRYRLTVPSLTALTTTSSGSIEAADLTGDTVEIKVTSSGSVAVGALQAGRLVVQITSSGKVSVTGGKVDQQDVKLSSSGSYAAKDLASTRATVDLTSSGDASIRVSDTLEARLSSSGNVFCVGSPQVKARTSSSGKVVTTPG